MDAYREVDNAHEDEAEEYYQQECFVVDFVKDMFEKGEAYYDGYPWSIQGDIIPGLDSDVVAEFVATIITEEDQVIIDKEKREMHSIIIDAANHLAVEIWQVSKEV